MRKSKPFTVLVVFVLTFAMVLPVCGVTFYDTETATTTVSDETPTTIYVSIFPSRPFLTVGQTKQLEPFSTNNYSWIWYSDDPSIASVSSTGLVTANAPGTTVIHIYYLTADNIAIRGECTVDVVDNTVFWGGSYFIRLNNASTYRVYPGYDFPGSLMYQGVIFYPEINAPNTAISYNNCKWYFDDLGDGYFLISHGLYTNYVLAVNGTATENQGVILKEKPSDYYSDSTIRWKVYSNGWRIILVPECAQGTGLVLSVASDSAGEKLCLKQYNGGSRYNSWKLYVTDFYLDNYYDESLIGEAGSVYREFISDANDFVSYCYNQLFEIDIKRRRTISYLSSVEGCVTDDSHPCDAVLCGEDCSTHHKNMYRLIYSLVQVGRENNHSVVVWSNRPWTAYCKKVQLSSGEYVHRANQESDGARTIAATYGSNVRFYTLGSEQADTEEIGAVMFITLAHEVAHMFGMNDVYNDDEHEAQDCFCAMKYYSMVESRKYYLTYMENPNKCERLYCDSCYDYLYQHVFKKFFNQ